MQQRPFSEKVGLEQMVHFALPPTTDGSLLSWAEKERVKKGEGEEKRG
jgi:hypothetical protein